MTDFQWQLKSLSFPCQLNLFHGRKSRDMGYNMGYDRGYYRSVHHVLHILITKSWQQCLSICTLYFVPQTEIILTCHVLGSCHTYYTAWSVYLSGLRLSVSLSVNFIHFRILLLNYWANVGIKDHWVKGIQVY